MIIVEYLCPQHGRFESLEQRPPPDDKPCPSCFRPAPWCISAPYGRVKLASATSHGYEAPPPGVLDTRAIGDGQSVEEWKADRAKIREAEREREAAAIMREM